MRATTQAPAIGAIVHKFCSHIQQKLHDLCYLQRDPGSRLVGAQGLKGLMALCKSLDPESANLVGSTVGRKAEERGSRSRAASAAQLLRSETRAVHHGYYEEK